MNNIFIFIIPEYLYILGLPSVQTLQMPSPQRVRISSTNESADTDDVLLFTQSDDISNAAISAPTGVWGSGGFDDNISTATSSMSMAMQTEVSWGNALLEKKNQQHQKEQEVFERGYLYYLHDIITTPE